MKLGAYLRLFKLNVPELSLYPLIAFGLASADVTQSRYWRILPLFLFFSLCCSTLTITLDDIAGYLDGVDQLTALNRKKNIAKPLLTKELSLLDAARAALVILSLAICLVIVLSLLTPRPALTALFLVGLLCFVTQYSFGLKLSYRGMGELVIAGGTALTTMLPFWMERGELPARVLWVGLMSGLPYAAQIVISNLIDYPSDRKAGRRTLTVLLGPRRAPWLSLAILALFWAVYACGMGRGELPRAAWCWLLLLPNHVALLWLAFADRAPDARLLSFHTIRLQLALFSTSLFAAGQISALG